MAVLIDCVKCLCLAINITWGIPVLVKILRRDSIHPGHLILLGISGAVFSYLVGWL